MWEHPLTRRHLRALAADAGAGHVPGHLDDVALAQINARSPRFRIVGPQVKALACGDVGDGAMADVVGHRGGGRGIACPAGPPPSIPSPKAVRYPPPFDTRRAT